MSIYVPSIQENSKLGICDGFTVRNRIVTFFVIKNYRKSVTTYPWERDVRVRSPTVTSSPKGFFGRHWHSSPLASLSSASHPVACSSQ